MHLVSARDAVVLEGNGIASGEAFGSAQVFLTRYIVATGIASAEAFGSPSLSYVIDATGIASGEAFGSATVSLLVAIVASGIGSAESFGTFTIRATRSGCDVQVITVLAKEQVIATVTVEQVIAACEGLTVTA